MYIYTYIYVGAEHLAPSPPGGGDRVPPEKNPFPGRLGSFPETWGLSRMKINPNQVGVFPGQLGFPPDDTSLTEHSDRICILEGTFFPGKTSTVRE